MADAFFPTRRAILIYLVASLAGCATAPEVVRYATPAAGPTAELAVKTDRMWSTNRVTLFLLRAEGGGKSRTAEWVGQLQSGEFVKREILSFDTKLPAGAPVFLHFEYRYEAGVLETGCDFPVTLTLEPGRRYLIDFVKDSHGCKPRFYVRGRNDELTEFSVIGN